jgi:hypothetical protein
VNTPRMCVTSQWPLAPEEILGCSGPPPHEKVTMFPTNAYVIRQATADDEGALRRLAELAGRQPLSGPVLVGEIGGIPAAAVSLADGRIAADPSKPTARLVPLLGIRFRAQRAFKDQPSLPARLKATMSGWKARHRPAPARALPDAGHVEAMEVEKARAA